MNVPRKRRLPYKPIRRRWPVGEHGPELFMPAKGAVVHRIDVSTVDVVKQLRKFMQGGPL